MLKVRFKILSLLEDILKHLQFNSITDFTHNIGNEHVVTSRNTENGGHIISIYSYKDMLQKYSLDTGVESEIVYGVITIPQLCLVLSITKCEELILPNNGTIAIRNDINLNTDDESMLFQLSTIYDDAILTPLALVSHFKHHSVLPLLNLGFSCYADDEDELNKVITDLESIKEKLYE
jgi:hypothetical protein